MNLNHGLYLLLFFVKTMCEEASVAGNKTNHSLRAYAATELFTAEIVLDTDHWMVYITMSVYRKQKEEACKVLAVKPGDTSMPNITTIESLQVHGSKSVSDLLLYMGALLIFQGP